MGTFGYLVLAGFVAFVLKKMVIDPEIELRNLIKAKEKEKEDQKKFAAKKRNKQESDFYGIDKMREQPSAFLQTVEETRKRLNAGEDVGVDAATAFYLIRNYKHSGLIAGEDGVINLRTLENVDYTFNTDKAREIEKWIMEFQPEGRSEESKPVVALPKYIAQVQDLPNGATRWVYDEQHSKDCGIKGLCFDRHGRSMPDPDDKNEEQKDKGRKGKSSSRERQDSEAKDASIKSSRLIELETETRADIMLTKAAEQTKNKNQNLFSEDAGDILESTEIKTDILKVSSVLQPAVYKDETEAIEEEFAIPKFGLIMESVKSDADPFFAPEEEPEKIDEFFSTPSLFEYGEMERFVSFVACGENFREKVLEKIFSKDGIGFVFANFVDRQVYIEKNYFARTVRDLIEKDEWRKFEHDFLSDGASEIFDGLKFSEVLKSMQGGRNMFLSYGRGGIRNFFNLLLQTGDDGTVFVNGWFAKMAFDAHCSIHDFLENFSGEISATVVASVPSEIESRGKKLKNVKRFY